MITIQRLHKDDANAFVKEHHRHNKPVPQMQITFCFGIWADVESNGDLGGNSLVGVVIVGEPCGRPKGKDRNLILEVRRVCFHKDFNHLKLKRWYPREDNEPRKDAPSLRKLPVVVIQKCGTGQIPIDYNYITAYKFPSMVMHYVDFFTKRYFNNIKYMWTYILKKENGKYLEEAGYIQDKVFKSRNRWKRRYVKKYAG